MGMELPPMGSVASQMDGVTGFAGYNHNLRLSPNEFYDMRNITPARLPVVSERPQRALLRKLAKPNGLFAHEKLCWVDGKDFYYGGEIKGQVADSAKQFVRMGAFVLIWPDKVFYNTHTDEYGHLEAENMTAGSVQYALSKNDGTLYGDYPVSDTAPEKPENGDLWMDTSTVPNVLRQYSDVRGMWTAIPTVYTKITAEGIGVGLEAYDGVTLSGFAEAELNGEFYLIGAGADYLIVTALIREAGVQTEPVTVARKVPDMDFMTECNNRIWGCSSAKHEIYSCTLGDPKNWNAFLGVAGDSYAATVGSAGDFTGAITHLDTVLFFKENIIHQLMGSKPANFTLTDSNVRGVARGSEKSLCVVNEVLFYRSVSDVCTYSAALPQTISAALGEGVYRNAVAGALNGRYYLCMEDADGKHALFTFDTVKNVWCREDDVQVQAFATLENELFFVDADGGLFSVRGSGREAYGDETARREPPVPWMLETGDIGLDLPYNKYISGIQLYAQVALGHGLRVEIQYDGAGAWTSVYQSAAVQRRSLLVPITTRRCRTLRVRLTGEGELHLYSLLYRTEAGSDRYAFG